MFEKGIIASPWVATEKYVLCEREGCWLLPKVTALPRGLNDKQGPISKSREPVSVLLISPLTGRGGSKCLDSIGRPCSTSLWLRQSMANWRLKVKCHRESTLLTLPLHAKLVCCLKSRTNKNSHFFVVAVFDLLLKLKRWITVRLIVKWNLPPRRSKGTWQKALLSARLCTQLCLSARCYASNNVCLTVCVSACVCQSERLCVDPAAVSQHSRRRHAKRHRTCLKAHPHS